LEEYKQVIDEWLKADLDAPRKQRHTARRVLARLVAIQAAVDVSYLRVRDYVAKRRPEIAAEAGRAWLRALCRRPMNPAVRRRSTSPTCG
jgi:hypothetical protein